MFYLYLEKEDYFELPEDYYPTTQNFQELELLINSKKENDEKKQE